MVYGILMLMRPFRPLVLGMLLGNATCIAVYERLTAKGTDSFVHAVRAETYERQSALRIVSKTDIGFYMAGSMDWGSFTWVLL